MFTAINIYVYTYIQWRANHYTNKILHALNNSRKRNFGKCHKKINIVCLGQEVVVHTYIRYRKLKFNLKKIVISNISKNIK